MRQGGWAQYHKEQGVWKWHFISQDTERNRGSYFSRKDCEAENRMVWVGQVIDESTGDVIYRSRPCNVWEEAHHRAEKKAHNARYAVRVV